MDVRLLYKNQPMSWGYVKYKEKANTYIDDFKVQVLLDTMSVGDELIYNCTKEVFLTPLLNEEQITYRQEILKDCLNNQQKIKTLYDIAASAIDDIAENKKLTLISDYSTEVLTNAIDKLRNYMAKFALLKEQTSHDIEEFHSEGFIDLFSRINNELGPDSMKEIDEILKACTSKKVRINATLGTSLRAADCTISKNTLFTNKKFGFLSDNDNTLKVNVGSSDTKNVGYLLELKQRGLENIANILATVVDNMQEFFLNLRRELSFYYGCINLYQELNKLNCKLCFPKVYPSPEKVLHFSNLYDVGLAISLKKNVVSNSLDLDQCDLIIITGANGGGKSTFIRSIGLSQIMTQSGLFVGADTFETSICDNIYTHFRKNEDAQMNSGKLDDELRRLSNMIEIMNRDSMLICNESFSSTNEKEGTEIALPIIKGLTENGIRLFFVTHFYSLVNYFYEKHTKVAILQAQRNEDGSRSYKLVQGEPNKSSFANDIYEQLFTK